MQGKARIIFPIIMAAVMSLCVSGFVTAINLGVDRDYLVHWARAWSLAFPVAAVTALVFAPVAQRLTLRLVALIERPAR